MPKVHILDLRFLSRKFTICSFLIKAGPAVGDVLIETGPHSTLSTLAKALEKQGSSLSAIKHVFLTHIHLDHAGAAWALAKTGAQVYVHPLGLPHLVDPSKLLHSASRIYGKNMHLLWGEVHPILSDKLQAVEDGAVFQIGDLRLQAHHTPGHARHHIAWQIEDVLFTGDVAGVRIGGGPAIPPCPPPDLDISAWEESLEKIAALRPSTLYLTHFGAVTKDIPEQIKEVKSRLHALCSWMKTYASSYSDNKALLAAFEQQVRDILQVAKVGRAEIAAYLAANPSFMSVLGLRLYLKKQEAVS